MTRRRVRLVDIDRLIDERFMPKRCQFRRRGRCQCGHVDLIHGPGIGGSHAGRCHGRGPYSRGACPCVKFTPYDYSKEQAKQRDKLRAFAFDVLRLDTPKEE